MVEFLLISKSERDRMQLILLHFQLYFVIYLSVAHENYFEMKRSCCDIIWRNNGPKEVKHKWKTCRRVMVHVSVINIPFTRAARHLRRHRHRGQHKSIPNLSRLMALSITDRKYMIRNDKNNGTSHWRDSDAVLRHLAGNGNIRLDGQIAILRPRLMVFSKRFQFYRTIKLYLARLGSCANSVEHFRRMSSASLQGVFWKTFLCNTFLLCEAFLTGVNNVNVFKLCTLKFVEKIMRAVYTLSSAQRNRERWHYVL